MSAGASDALMAYDWPGNVRELVNFCRRATVLAPGSEIRIADLPAVVNGVADTRAAPADWTSLLTDWAQRHAAQQSGKPLLDVALPEFERTLIRVALAHTQGHRQEAARLLGWGRNTLTRKLRELGMDEADA
jgi:two-component system nitrogen regulation response regulator GlnG